MTLAAGAADAAEAAGVLLSGSEEGHGSETGLWPKLWYIGLVDAPPKSRPRGGGRGSDCGLR